MEEELEHEEAEDRIAQLEERLAAVAQAEERLREGRYGTRVASGGPLPHPGDAVVDRLPRPER